MPRFAAGTMRRRRGTPIHGWLVIDKPEGLTSAQVVGRVRRITGAAKLGHGGTLDPLATGVLPIALGEATKTVSYVMDGAKTYRFTVRWGEARDTDDIEGRVTAASPMRPTEGAIRSALAAFVGDIVQAPPVYSAIKIDGERAYKRARADEVVRPEPRIVRVDSLTLLSLDDPDHATFEVACGKGTYVRALARDLGAALGTLGAVSALRRLRVGPFSEAHAISLEELGANMLTAPPTAMFSVETALDDIPALAMTETQAGDLRQGRPVAWPSAGQGGETVLATHGGKPVALARIESGTIRPVRVLNL
jgi:tRNA pseudouridine55 synthase